MKDIIVIFCIFLWYLNFGLPLRYDEHGMRNGFCKRWRVVLQREKIEASGSHDIPIYEHTYGGVSYK